MPHRRAANAAKHFLSDPATLLMVAVCILVFTMFSYGTYKQLHDARQTKTALCIFKYDLIKRRDAGLAYLKAHPNDKFILGIPRAQIQQSIDAQTSTIASLRVLSCPQDEQ